MENPCDPECLLGSSNAPIPDTDTIPIQIHLMTYFLVKFIENFCSSRANSKILGRWSVSLGIRLGRIEEIHQFLPEFILGPFTYRLSPPSSPVRRSRIKDTACCDVHSSLSLCHDGFSKKFRLGEDYRIHKRISDTRTLASDPKLRVPFTRPIFCNLAVYIFIPRNTIGIEEIDVSLRLHSFSECRCGNIIYENSYRLKFILLDLLQLANNRFQSTGITGYDSFIKSLLFFSFQYQSFGFNFVFSLYEFFIFYFFIFFKYIQYDLHSRTFSFTTWCADTNKKPKDVFLTIFINDMMMTTVCTSNYTKNTQQNKLMINIILIRNINIPVV